MTTRQRRTVADPPVQSATGQDRTEGRSRPGILWLIPVPLDDASDPLLVLPQETLHALRRLDRFVAERARSARAVLKAVGNVHPLQSISIAELSEHTTDDALPALLAPLLEGHEVGLLSEAGCPAVADPGAKLVCLAHQHAVPVRPLIGPSALLLALMASGLNGQRFAFAGYLPQDPAELTPRILALEERSRRSGETELFIETPYRNQRLFDALLSQLAPDTSLLVASALTSPEERIECRPVREWRRSSPALPRVPTVFALLAEPGPGKGSGRSAQRRLRQPS